MDLLQHDAQVSHSCRHSCSNVTLVQLQDKHLQACSTCTVRNAARPSIAIKIRRIHSSSAEVMGPSGQLSVLWALQQRCRACAEAFLALFVEERQATCPCPGPGTPSPGCTIKCQGARAACSSEADSQRSVSHQHAAQHKCTSWTVSDFCGGGVHFRPALATYGWAGSRPRSLRVRGRGGGYCSFPVVLLWLP